LHIHIPDGVLPIWLWIAGYILTFLAIGLIYSKLSKNLEKVPLVGTLTAFTLVVMSIPLGIPTHLNFSVFDTFLVGPYWYLIIAFIVNFILASFGHGGVTIVGLNTILLWFQGIAGNFLFKFFKRTQRFSFSIFFATFFALILSFLFIIFIVFISKVEPIKFSHSLSHLGKTKISLRTFIFLSLPIVLFNVTVESLVTTFLINFIKKIKPDLIKL